MGTWRRCVVTWLAVGVLCAPTLAQATTPTVTISRLAPNTAFGFTLAGPRVAWSATNDRGVTVYLQAFGGTATEVGHIAFKSVNFPSAQLMASADLVGVAITYTLCTGESTEGCLTSLVNVGHVWTTPGASVAPVCQQAGTPCAECLTDTPEAVSGDVVLAGGLVCDVATGQVITLRPEAEALALSGPLVAIANRTVPGEVTVEQWQTGQALYSVTLPTSAMPPEGSVVLDGDGTLTFTTPSGLEQTTPASPTPSPVFSVAPSGQITGLNRADGIVAVSTQLVKAASAGVGEPAGLPTVQLLSGDAHSAAVSAPGGWSFDGTRLAVAASPCGTQLIRLAMAADPQAAAPFTGACGLPQVIRALPTPRATLEIDLRCPTTTPAGCAADVTVRAQTGHMLAVRAFALRAGQAGSLRVRVPAGSCAPMTVMAVADPNAVAAPVPRTPTATRTVARCRSLTRAPSVAPHRPQ